MGTPLLVDSGTYCYNAAPEYRRYFRGTKAHNTLMVDHHDQAVYGGSFLWMTEIHTQIEEYEESDSKIIVRASHNGYQRLPDPVTHVREVELNKTTLTISIRDWIRCKNEHFVSLNWHLHPSSTCNIHGDQVSVSDSNAGLLLKCSHSNLKSCITHARPGHPDGWISNKFGELLPSTVISYEGYLSPEDKVLTLIQILTPDLQGVSSPYMDAEGVK
jgi:uncharacterized heparinase superfamily protein